MRSITKDRIKHRKSVAGFSLIEMLVVMSISAILIGLIMYPLYQSFVITRMAEAQMDAQRAARQTSEQIKNELSQAMFVYDNSTNHIQLPVYQVSTGNVVFFELPHARLDFVLPKMIMHCNNPAHPEGEPRDFPRGNRDWPDCPVCGSKNVESRPTLPMEQSQSVVRYFLGTMNNNTENNPSGVPMYAYRSPWRDSTPLGEQNQVVLYRIELDPYDPELFSDSMGPVDRMQTFSEMLTDPLFFYRDNFNGHSTPSGRPFYEVLRQRARVLGIARYSDLVIAEYDLNDDVQTIEPTITFRFNAISNDSFSGVTSEDGSAPWQFASTYPYWTDDFRVSVFRYVYSYDPSGNESVDKMVEFSTRTDTATGDLMVFRREWTQATDWVDIGYEFNISDYLATGEIKHASSSDPPEMAFVIDKSAGDLNRGTVHFALDPFAASSANTWALQNINALTIDAQYMAQYAVDRSARRSTYLIDPALTGLNRPRVVPASDSVRLVIPGNTTINFTRVTDAYGRIGHNQYAIDYDTSEIFFNSDPGDNWQALPPDAYFEFDYKVRFNTACCGKKDHVKGDYITKSLVTTNLGMQLYDPESGRPFTTELSDSVEIKNALR